MALVFIPTGDDDGMTPYFIPTGSILENSNLKKFAVDDTEVLKSHLMGMTKEKLTDTLAKLKLKPNRKSMTKFDLTTLIAEKMTFLTKRATDMTASSSSTLTQQEDKEDKPTTETTMSITATSVAMDRTGKIESVNHKPFNEFLEEGAFREPEPEEEEPVTWTRENEHVLRLLDEMHNSGLNVNPDERIMLMEKKQKFMEQQQHKMLQEDMSKVDEDEMTEDCIISLLDFCGIMDDDLDKFFLDDKSDFYENPFSIKVLDCRGGRELFKLKVELNTTTCADLKNEIVRKIEHIGGNHIPADNFNLCSGLVKIKDDEVFDGSVSEVYVNLKLRGGGIHQTYSKKKNIRDERLFSIKGRYNVVSYSFQLAEKAKLEAEELMNSSAGAVPDAIKKLDLASCNKLLEMWETGQTSGERFGLEIAPIFCPTLQTIDDILEKHSKIYEMLQTAFLFIFSRDYIATNGRFLLTNFKDAVVERRTELEHQAEMNRLVQQAVASKGAGKGSDVEM